MQGLVAAPRRTVRCVLDNPVSEQVYQSKVRVVNHAHKEVPLARVIKLLESLLLRPGVSKTPGVLRDVELALGNG